MLKAVKNDNWKNLYPNTRLHIHTHARAYAQNQTDTHMLFCCSWTHTHARTHARTHTQTHTHTTTHTTNHTIYFAPLNRVVRHLFRQMHVDEMGTPLRQWWASGCNVHHWRKRAQCTGTQLEQWHFRTSSLLSNLTKYVLMVLIIHYTVDQNT